MDAADPAVSIPQPPADRSVLWRPGRFVGIVR